MIEGGKENISEMLPLPPQVEREHSERQRRNIHMPHLPMEGKTKKAGAKGGKIGRRTAKRAIKAVTGFICCFMASMLILPETAGEMILLLAVVSVWLLAMERLMK